VELLAPKNRCLSVATKETIPLSEKSFFQVATKDRIFSFSKNRCWRVMRRERHIRKKTDLPAHRKIALSGSDERATFPLTGITFFQVATKGRLFRSWEKSPRKSSFSALRNVAVYGSPIKSYFSALRKILVYGSPWNSDFSALRKIALPGGRKEQLFRFSKNRSFNSPRKSDFSAIR